MYHSADINHRKMKFTDRKKVLPGWNKPHAKCTKRPNLAKASEPTIYMNLNIPQNLALDIQQPFSTKILASCGWIWRYASNLIEHSFNWMRLITYMGRSNTFADTLEIKLTLGFLYSRLILNMHEEKKFNIHEVMNWCENLEEKSVVRFCWYTGVHIQRKYYRVVKGARSNRCRGFCAGYQGSIIN